MTVIVKKFCEPQIRDSVVLAGKTCLVIGGLVSAQVASALVVFSL